MFNSVNALHTSSPTSTSDASRALTADFLFDKLNPANMAKESDVFAHLDALNKANGEVKKNIVQVLQGQLAAIPCGDKEYLKNDVDMLKNVLADLSSSANNSLELTLKHHAVAAVKKSLYSFSFDDFSIRHRNVHNESVNFNRLLPSLGLAAQSYGYFGRKIILNTAEHMLEGYQKASRYQKLSKVILDDAPSNEAASMSAGDYYMDYCMTHGDSLDEPYDKTKLS